MGEYNALQKLCRRIDKSNLGWSCNSPTVGIVLPPKKFKYSSLIDRQLISKVRTVLEAQSPRQKNRVASTGPSPAGHTERITTRTNARQFESFLRSISNTSSLLDARRLKNDIVGEIRRTRLLLGL